MTDQPPSGKLWRISCSREAFEAHRHDPRLHRIVTLARIVNSIRFTDSAAFDRHGEDTPSAQRQRAGSFLYLTGILYEAFRFADRLGEQFRESEAFRAGFAQLLKDPVVRRLRDGLLNRLRNEAVYHHDDAVYSEGMALIKAQEYLFLSAASKKASDAYYDLADLAILRYAIGSDADSETFLRELSDSMIKVLEVANRFASCAETLIREVLNTMPWMTVGPSSDDAAV